MEKDEETPDDSSDYHGSVIGNADTIVNIRGNDMLEIQGDLDLFIEKLKNSRVYQEYEEQKNRMKQNPELKQQVDEFRRRSYELQMRTYSENLYDEMDRFQREYEEFRERPQVHDFLTAELALCRMIQTITSTIAESVLQDFE